jgi:hypothetical protein
MNKLQRKLVSAAAGAALMLNTLTPAFAATTLQITGNGSDSESETVVGMTQTTTVSQSNTANVTNTIDANANTGNNSASDNTGGDVDVDTGDASVTTTVENTLNHNSAQVDRCDGCGFGDVDVEVSGNGTDSDNSVGLGVSNYTTVGQNNNAYVSNYVNSDAKTGNNDADDNTGGDVSINTGDAETETIVSTTANSNHALVGGNGDSGSVSALISGNGSDSDNDVALGLVSATTMFQDNSAIVYNTVYSDAKTGGNDANDNTDGDVEIETGDASVMVDIANALNSNSAHVMGENGGSVSAMITGNGSDSDNEMSLGLYAFTTLYQDNHAWVDNYVNADAKTGHNDADDNTGGSVSIDTGDADVDVNIETMANFNIADVECDCLFDSVLAKIAGNGEDSDNTIAAELIDDLYVSQDNCGSEFGWFWWDSGCSFNNSVYADGRTGKNDVDDNTGETNGDPSVDTGDADVMIDVMNSGNANVYGDEHDMELPFPTGSGINLNISFDLSDLLAWIMGDQA